MTVKNIVRIMGITLFLLFLGLYFSQSTGYYDLEQTKKKNLTESQIKKFEQDLEEGKEIDLENYTEVGKKDYKNKISSASLSLSNTIEKAFDKGMSSLFKALDKVMNDDNK